MPSFCPKESPRRRAFWRLEGTDDQRLREAFRAYTLLAMLSEAAPEIAQEAAVAPLGVSGGVLAGHLAPADALTDGDATEGVSEAKHKQDVGLPIFSASEVAAMPWLRVLNESSAPPLEASRVAAVKEHAALAARRRRLRVGRRLLRCPPRARRHSMA